MLWDLVGAIFFLSPIVVMYLIYRNYQLEKRWRCLRYCWHVMSDFAAESTRNEDGSGDLGWKEVASEHEAFMKRFGIEILSKQHFEIYELALLERNLPLLVEHKMW